MTVFEAVGRGSIPRRGAESIVLGVCRIRTRLCEGRRPGSIHGENTLLPTLEPDGEAIGCNPVEVGSTPNDVSSNASMDGSTRTL